MRKRRIIKTRPDLEQLEEKRPLSAGASTAPLTPLKAESQVPASRPAETAGAAGAVNNTPKVRAVPARQSALAPKGSSGPRATAQKSISAEAVKPTFGFLVFRLTNPDHFSNKLVRPSGHVLVQEAQPVPGQVYNVLSITMRNSTAQTFNASSGLLVGFPGGPHYFPILTGNEQWKPGQEFVFYVLTKKYYPIANQVSGGFIFILGGAKSIAIPGPSGIFLRLTYNPATINRVLDSIVAFGQGAEGGTGIKTGIADTSIYAFVSAKTNRNDFGGYF